MDANGVDGIRKITLKKVEIDWCNPDNVIAEDVCHGPSPPTCGACAMPMGGRLSRAVFLIQFADAERPRTVEVVPPNTLNLERPADGDVVTRWLGNSWLLVAGQPCQRQVDAV